MRLMSLHVSRAQLVVIQLALVILMFMVFYQLLQVNQKLDSLTVSFRLYTEEHEAKLLELSKKSLSSIHLPVEKLEVPVAKPENEIVPNNPNEKTLGGVATALPPLEGNNLTYLPMLEGENVVAMSLWGEEPKYTTGALRNAELVKQYLPGWKLRVYVELPSDSPKYGLVPKDILNKLRDLGADLNYMDASTTRVPPMMWRFLVGDDLSVDRFVIRDTDSRLSARDAAAIYMWVKSGKALHCVRDHPSHSSFPLSGGLWGGMPSAVRDILRRPWKDIMYGFRTDYFQDMSFLINVIWPRLKDHFYCSDAYSCDKFPSSHPFPIPRYGYEHIGQVFDSTELSRPTDIRIMREAGLNPRCSPPRRNLTAFH